MIKEHIGRAIREDGGPFERREDELTDAEERLAASLNVTLKWVEAAREGGQETGGLLEDAYNARDLIEEELVMVRADLEVLRKADQPHPAGLAHEQRENLARLLLRCDALQDAYGVVRDAPPESFGGTTARHVMMRVLWRGAMAAGEDVDRYSAENGIKD